MNNEQLIEQLIKNYGLKEVTQIDEHFSMEVMRPNSEYLCFMTYSGHIVKVFTGHISESLLSQALAYLNKLSNSTCAIDMFRELGLFKSIVTPAPSEARQYLSGSNQLIASSYINVYDRLWEGKGTTSWW